MDLKQLLVLHEGLRLKPYRCTAGKLTIGIGRNLDDRGITENEAYMMLENDMKSVRRECEQEFKFFSRLGEVRQAVIMDMCFNLGLSRLLGFKNTLQLIDSGQYDLAADAMLKSLWSRQVGARAVRLSEMMRNGKWP
jgi:lysozyme